METITEYLPFIIPLCIAQIGLGIFSAVHVWKHNNYRFGNRAFWMVVVLLGQIIGPVLYFIIGRGYE